MIDQKTVAEAYQPLFDLMTNHGLTLLASEMDDIRDAVDLVNENLHLLFCTCDVEGCYTDPSSGGLSWRETGYWSTCPEHNNMFKKGEPQPKMKQRAIDKESKRKPDGTLPSNYLL